MALDEMWRSLKPYLFMVFLQVGFSGMYIISVASLKGGMNHYVLVVYRNSIAAAVVAPFALWFEGFVPLSLYLFLDSFIALMYVIERAILCHRKTRPKMTLSVFFKIMALALLEY